MSEQILLIDDDALLRRSLAFALERAGYQVITAATAEDGLAQIAAARPDLVLLDIGLPGMDGLDALRQMRRHADLPVIFVTARRRELEQVLGLELGADDYVTKPFSHRELVARIRAVLRRGADVELLPDVVEAGGVRMDLERHDITVRGEPVKLALKEFELLELLLRNNGRVLTRGQLIDRVWGPDYVGDTKTLDVHVKRLRAKIEQNPAEPQLLLTVRGLGYRFEG